MSTALFVAHPWLLVLVFAVIVFGIVLGGDQEQ